MSMHDSSALYIRYAFITVDYNDALAYNGVICEGATLV